MERMQAMSEQSEVTLRRVRELAESWGRSSLPVFESFAAQLYAALAVHKGDPITPQDLAMWPRYMVLNRETPTTLWDGDVHPRLETAAAELRDAQANPAEYGTGWYLAEVREVQP